MLTTRYLMKNLLSAASFVALTLTAVIWLTQSLKMLELVANSDAPAWLFLEIVGLMLPKFLETVLPVSLVIAALFTYNRMIMDNELIILRSCGFNQHTLARPALLIAGLMTALLLALTLYVTPVSSEKMIDLRHSLKSQYSAFLLREGVFNTFGKGLTVYVRGRQDNGDLTGLVIHDTRDKNRPPVTITAKRGKLIMNGDTPNILVFDGMRQQIDADTGVLSRLYFVQYMIEINGLGSDAANHDRDPTERTFTELLHPDMASKYDREHLAGFRSEAQLRLLQPFNAIAFSISALAILLIGPFNRRGQGRKVMAASLVVIVLLIANLALNSAIKKYPALMPVQYILAFVPIGASLYALGFSGEQKIMGLLRYLNRRRNSQLQAEGGAA